MKHKLRKISFPWGSLREKIKHRFSLIVEEVFRGYKRAEPVDIGEFAGAAGFRLILKEDEPSFLKRWEAYKANPLPLSVLPRTAPLPPLWRVSLI
jgi:hypothetical protein